MFKTWLLSLLSIVIINHLHSQNQNNQWRFGIQGSINFNINPPSSPGSAIQTPEGSASIADPTTGALLFYTDGVTVWDANDQPMPNGTGLLGSTSGLLSSTTAAVIIPKPFSSSQYYLVTIDEQFSNSGIRYSLVDMTLNGGLGDIVAGQKNQFLFSTNSEKLQVVPTADGCAYWLLTHDNPGNSFIAFKVTENGFQTPPVITSGGNTQGNGAGHFKVNRQFNKIALGSFFDSTVELFDFNNATGQVSNPLIWDFAFLNGLLYGVEFSPDGSKLYVTNIEKIVQYDISLPSAAAIQASAYEVSQNLGIGYQPASLQLGPDGKIYIAAGTIDAINFPNNAGAGCGFVQNAIPLQNGVATYGLPQWVYYNNPATGNNAILVQDTCLGNTAQLAIQNPSGTVSITWDFGDPATGANNAASVSAPGHVFSQPGTFTVQAVLLYGCFADTITQSIEIVDCNIGITGIKIMGDTCSSLRSFQIEGSSNAPYFFWNFGDPLSGPNDTITIVGASPSPFPTHNFSALGTYTVCASWQEPGEPVSTICQDITIDSCSACKVFVPNVFSPNDDGYNDAFSPIPTCSVEQYTFSVFNRWGEQVYKTNNISDQWDGRFRGSPCPSDVYVYLVTYATGASILQSLSGDVTLLR